MPSSTIVDELRRTLAAHLPFSAMERADLDHLIERSAVAYYAPGESLLRPDSGVPAHCFIVRQGRVEAFDRESSSVALEAAAGDCFPLGALLAERPVTLDYRAAGDCFCLLLPRADFNELTRRSPAFIEFCRRRLGVMLDSSRRQMQQAYAVEAGVQQTMETALGSLMRGEPIFCAPNTPLGTALARMNAAAVGSIVVVEPADEGERVVGILTQTDLIGRVILPQVSMEVPISQVMTKDVLTLDADDTAGAATLLMAEHAVRHVPVLKSEGNRRRLVGVVSERNLFALQRMTMRQLAAAIARAGDVPELATVAAEVRRLSHHLVAQGVASAQLTRLISHLNDQLTARLLTLGCALHGIDRATFCWLSFGSEGRSEQTIATDQDNGLLFNGGAPPRERLLAFADWANQGLASCGYPLCKGNIMALNPAWCLSDTQWSAQFYGWIERGDPQALLDASIFFDLRPLFGRSDLALQLHADVVAKAQANRRFLKQMADNAARNRVPTVGRLIDALFDPATGRVDLKLNGTVPFVDAARIWSLDSGIAETNTSARLAQLAQRGRLPADDVRGWIAAFEFLQLLRLRVQHQRTLPPGVQSADADVPAAVGHAHPAPDVDPSPNPNEVDLASLTSLDRRILNESLRQGRKILQHLAMDFPG